MKTCKRCGWELSPVSLGDTCGRCKWMDSDERQARVGRYFPRMERP